MTGNDAAHAGAPGTTGEPSPIAQLGPTIRRLPRYIVLARNLLRDPRLSRWRKAGLVASIAYVASPIDLVPGLIPVAGQLDDLAALLLGVRTALRGGSAAGTQAHLRAAGLTAADLERDLAVVRAAAGWIAGRVGGAAVKAGRISASGAVKLLGIGARGARTLAVAAARRARRA